MNPATSSTQKHLALRSPQMEPQPPPSEPQAPSAPPQAPPAPPQVPPPAYRLHSPAGVTWATALGGPTAGSIVLALNYWKWGQKAVAVAVVAAGFVATAIIAWLAIITPASVPAFVFLVPQLVGGYVVARWLQGRRFDAHVAAGGGKVSVRDRCGDRSGVRHVNARRFRRLVPQYRDQPSMRCSTISVLSTSATARRFSTLAAPRGVTPRTSAKPW